MKMATSDRVHRRNIALDSGQIRDNLKLYFQRHRETYRLTRCAARRWNTRSGLELLDFSRVRRYCDVASCASPIQKTFAAYYPQVEF